nr:nucleoside hydrolase [Anaerolineae bacterium]
MKKRRILIIAMVLLAMVVVLLAAGPILATLGVPPLFCVEGGNGHIRFVSCESEPVDTFEQHTTPVPVSADAQPTLIDTDMAADDWMAILYLLQRPDVEVLAITVTGTGEAHCEPGVQNALDLAALAGRPDIPVACGRETPLAGDHVFPTSWRSWVDSLAGVDIPSNPNSPASQTAMELIADAVQEADGNLEIITLGPLTNLAEAFQSDPLLADNLSRVFIMGGAFYVPGNVADVPEMRIDNSAAEWNIYIDPVAAQMVVESGAPITFVPLDACNHVLLDEAFYRRLGNDRTTPAARFVYQVLTENIGFVQSGSYYFWDPLTAAVAVDSSLASFEIQSVIVVDEEGANIGVTRVNPTGSQVQIAVSADGDAFKQQFLDVLNSRTGD